MAIVNIYARARKPSHPAEPSEDLLKLLEYVCTRMQDFNFVTMSKREIEKSLGGEQAAVNAVEFLSVTLSFPQTNRETDGASILFYLSLPTSPHPSDETTARDLAVSIVETLFVLAEFSFWKVHRLYTHDLKVRPM